MPFNLSAQMDQRFNGEDCHARGLLSLVPSLFLDSSVNPDHMLKWEKDLQGFKKSFRNFTFFVWNSHLPLYSSIGLPPSFFTSKRFSVLFIVGCTLPISSADAERSFSLMTNQRVLDCPHFYAGTIHSRSDGTRISMAHVTRCQW